MNNTSFMGVELGVPLSYTGNQAKRIYSTANYLLEYINIYNFVVPYVGNMFLSELKGEIRSIFDSATGKDYAFKRDIIVKNEYRFSESKELLSIIKDNAGGKIEVHYINSLRNLKAYTTTSYSNSKFHDFSKVYLNSVMDFEKFEVKDYQGERTEINTLKREKYLSKDNVVYQKIRYINASGEASKVRIYFDSNSNITRVTAHDQKYKDKLLYQSIYKYNHLNNIELITFEKFDAAGAREVFKEYCFKYDNRGNLIESPSRKYSYDDMGNMVHEEFYGYYDALSYEVFYYYEYDSRKNWIGKGELAYSYDYEIGKKILARESITERVVQYY